MRTPLFNAIMYNSGGLGRSGRELGAIGASVVNRCIYCAAVHASRYNQLTRTEDHVREIFAEGEAAALPTREAAIFDFAVKLSKTPSVASEADMRALREAGLTEEEILDLVLSTALFGWANRLMHILGDPVAEPESEA